MQRNAVQNEISNADIIRFSGLFAVGFSIITSLILLFAVPSMSNYLFGFLVMVLGVFLVLGIVAFVVGTAMARRDSR